MKKITIGAAALAVLVLTLALCQAEEGHGPSVSSMAKQNYYRQIMTGAFDPTDEASVTALRNQIAGEIFASLVGKGTTFINGSAFPKQLNLDALAKDSIDLANEFTRRLKAAGELK